MSVADQTKSDGRSTRSWWHEEAKQMKRDGVKIADIALKFGRHEASVRIATKGIIANGKRRFQGEAVGFKHGNLRRVAVSFTDEQVQHLNSLASRGDISFSLAVTRLVDESIARRA
jgi:hypothetical protein